jgi:hypothetical protein
MGLDLFDRAARLRADRESPRSGNRDEGIEHGQSRGDLNQVRVSREAYVDPTQTSLNRCRRIAISCKPDQRRLFLFGLRFTWKSERIACVEFGYAGHNTIHLFWVDARIFR